MKVEKLIVNYTYDFELYGVTTSLKDYKMAWLINKQISINLIREEDYLLESAAEKAEIVNYCFQEGQNELRIFKNKAILENQDTQNYMVPEMKHFDYFIMVRGIIHIFTSEDLLQELRIIEGVQLVNQINIEKLKSRDHFIF